MFRNLKSARFADYNNQIKLKIDHRPNSKVDADLTVDYGKTYMSKVNKHRLSILTATKYNINKKKGAGVVNYNVTFKLPSEVNIIYFLLVKISDEYNSFCLCLKSLDLSILYD